MKTFDDKRKDMIEYLEDKVRMMQEDHSSWDGSQVGLINLKMIVELLKAPIMPEHPSDELLAIMSNARRGRPNDHPLYPWSLNAYDALRAALLTPPKPKMKTVWKLSYTWRNSNYVDTLNTEERATNTKEIIHKDKEFTNVSPIWSEEVEDK